MILQARSQLAKLALLCVGAFVVLDTTGDRFYVESRTQETSPAAQTSQISSEAEAIDEASESDDPILRANRAAKKARYDSQVNDRDLTSLPPGQSMHLFLCGQYDPTILPTASHDVIVLGTLLNTQPYLSANRTAIYTEYQLYVEEIFKPSQEDLSLEQGRLVIDRPGGVLRMRSGRVISSTESGTGMARPLDVGRRYVLFCRLIHDQRDLILGFAFELRDEKAYALSEHRGHDRLVGELPGAVAALSNEQSFVEAVRDAVNHPGSPQYFSAPRK
jgi:hypothetical protein